MNIRTVSFGSTISSQGLFFFGNSQPVLWERDLLPIFTDLPQPAYAWRWHGRNPELGEWLVGARRRLMVGDQLELHGAPLQVVSSTGLTSAARALPPHPERSVVMKRWPNGLRSAFSPTRCRIHDDEGARRHLLAFADLIDEGGQQLANGVATFAISCAFGIAPVFGAGQRRPLMSKSPSPLSLRNFPDYLDQVRALNRLLEDQSRQAVLEALLSLRQLPKFWPHRREAWLGVLDAVRLSCARPLLTGLPQRPQRGRLEVPRAR
jgi:hypothetical protein